MRSLDARPGNLPAQVTTFVGRGEQLEALHDLLRDRPLVTLVGVGGVGKTRLALEAARELASDHPDGAWLCEFAPVGDPDALWEVIATTLGAPTAPGRPVEAVVLDYLAEKSTLLVLDNCEHLLAAARRTVDAITRRCPGVAIIATSREGLALPGEQLLAVPSLELPDGDDSLEALVAVEAVRLFVERAQEARQDFALNGENARAVAQLCRRVDGIPLAIELAAARTRSMAPRELVERLDQRFRLLTRGSRSGLERHQTLRSTIDWSYELLTPHERTVFNRLSVFAGGSDLRAAEHVLADDQLDADDVTEVLGELVDKSLVVVETNDERGTRYSQLEMIRQYAAERLEETGESSTLRARHADYFVGVAEAVGSRLRGRDQYAAAAEIAPEVDNFRAVLDWALEGNSSDHALRLIAALAVSGMATGYLTMPWAEAARKIPGATEHPMYPVVVAWASWSAVMRGDFDAGRALADEATTAQERLGTKDLWVYMATATVAFFAGDSVRAVKEAEEWTRQARADGDPYEIASALVLLAGALSTSDPTRAIDVAEEAVKLAREAGTDSVLSIGLSVLSIVTVTSDPDRSMSILDETREVALRIGDRQAASQVPLHRAWMAAMEHEEWKEALGYACVAADEKLALGDVAILGVVFCCACVAFAGLGANEQAAVLFGAKTTPFSFADDTLELLQRVETELIEALGHERFSALLARGQAMPPTDAVTYLRTEAARLSPG